MDKSIPKNGNFLSTQDGIILSRVEPDFDVYWLFFCNKHDKRRRERAATLLALSYGVMTSPAGTMELGAWLALGRCG